MSNYDSREILKMTGLEQIAYEQDRAILQKRLREMEEEMEGRKKREVKDCPLTRGEGFSFLLSKLLKKKKVRSLTLDQIKELKLKKAKAKEHFDNCCEKMGVRDLVLGKGVVKYGPTDEEIKEQQFERIKQMLEERNKFDTWVLYGDPNEKKEKKTWANINSKKDLMEVVEEKKRKMKEESIKNIRKAENARKNLPSLPFYY